MTTSNSSTFEYPPLQGHWKEKGLIVGENLKLYPKLFNLAGDKIRTWKEGLNGEL